MCQPRQTPIPSKYHSSNFMRILMMMTTSTHNDLILLQGTQEHHNTTMNDPDTLNDNSEIIYATTIIVTTNSIQSDLVSSINTTNSSYLIAEIDDGVETSKREEEESLEYAQGMEKFNNTNSYKQCEVWNALLCIIKSDMSGYYIHEILYWFHKEKIVIFMALSLLWFAIAWMPMIYDTLGRIKSPFYE